MEMIIVISIIIILASISVPAFFSSIRRGRYSGSANLVQATLMKAKKSAYEERAIVSVEFYHSVAEDAYYMQLECRNAKWERQEVAGNGTNPSYNTFTLTKNSRSPNWVVNEWAFATIHLLDASDNYRMHSATVISNTPTVLTLRFDTPQTLSDGVTPWPGVEASDMYWIEGGVKQLGQRVSLRKGIMFSFTIESPPGSGTYIPDPDWGAEDGWVGSRDVNDDYPDIAFRPDGIMADDASEGRIVIREDPAFYTDADPDDKIIIRVNKLTGFISME